MGDVIAFSSVAGALGALAFSAFRDKLLKQSEDAEVIQMMRSSFCGEIFTPNSAEYEREKAMCNSDTENAPALIFLPANTADVQKAVLFCKEFDLANPDRPKTVVRGGGFCYGAVTASVGGCVIDMKRMRSVSVDRGTKTCWAEGGALSKDVDSTADAFGLWGVTGHFSHEGVCAFATGGGFGMLSHRYGLAMDSILEAELVLSNGQIAHCSKTENVDLFWALRGGGRWLGCITRLKFQLHSRPHPNVVNAILPFPIEAYPKVLQTCDNMQSEEFNYFFCIVSHPELVGVSICLVHAVFFSAMDDARIRYQRMIELIGTAPINGDKSLQEMSWPSANRSIDHLVPWGTPMQAENFNLPDTNNTDNVVDFLRIVLERKPPQVTIMIDHVIGEAYENDSDSMWMNRAPFFGGMFLCLLTPPVVGIKEASQAFVKGIMSRTRDLRISGRCVNCNSGTASLTNMYGPDVAERFTTIKAKYDPEGFFGRSP